MSDPKKFKEFMVNIGLLIVTCLMFLIALEVFFRFYNPYDVESVWDVRETSDNNIFNSRGIRGPEYSFEHSGYRIIALGDSFTYGVQLYENSSWPYMLEAKLRGSGYNDIQVLNAARPGSATVDQYGFFVNNVSKFNPDMVIVGYLINDCSRICMNCGAVKLKMDFELALFIPNRVDRLSALYRFLRLTKLKHDLTEKTMESYLQPYKMKTLDYRRCIQAFRDFKKRSDEEGFELIVVIYPMLYDLNPTHRFKEIHEHMLDFFKKEGITAYDLTPAFYGQKDYELWLNYKDSHPNRKAHDIASSEILKHIEPYLKG